MKRWYPLIFPVFQLRIETVLVHPPCAQHSPIAISPARTSQTLELAALVETATESFADNDTHTAPSPVRESTRNYREICSAAMSAGIALRMDAG